MIQDTKTGIDGVTFWKHIKVIKATKEEFELLFDFSNKAKHIMKHNFVRYNRNGSISIKLFLNISIALERI